MITLEELRELDDDERHKRLAREMEEKSFFRRLTVEEIINERLNPDAHGSVFVCEHMFVEILSSTIWIWGRDPWLVTWSQDLKQTVYILNEWTSKETFMAYVLSEIAIKKAIQQTEDQ